MSDLDKRPSRARHRQPLAGDRSRRGRWSRLALGAVVGVVLAVAAGWWVTDAGLGGEPRPEAATPPDGGVGSERPSRPSAELQLDLEDFTFTVSGVVPDQATVDALSAATLRTYGERGSVAVEVDPDVAGEPWLERSPFLVRNFTRLLGGRLSIDGDEAVLTGAVPDQASLEFFRDALSPEAGFPALSLDGLDVTELRSPELRATAIDGQLTVSGVVPSRSLRDRIVAGAVELYGEERVTDEIRVDPATSSPYELIRFPDDLAALEPAGDFEVGVRDGTLRAVIAESIAFELGESRLDPRAERLLASFDELIDRIAGVVTITGHTDDIGSTVDNLALSEERAGAVAVELVAGGVDPTRLVVIGMGESDPIADNASEEGRARNRRVEITIGPAP